MTVNVNDLISELAKYSEPRSTMTNIKKGLGLFDENLETQTALLIDKTIAALKTAQDKNSVIAIIVKYTSDFLSTSHGQTGLSARRTSGWLSPSRSQKIVNNIFKMFSEDGKTILEELQHKHERDISDRLAWQDGAIPNQYVLSKIFNNAVNTCAEQIGSLYIEPNTPSPQPS